MPQSAQLRGSHHCIGTGRAIADLIFKMVHDKAVANGGALSAEEILGVKAEFIVSLPSGMDFFEKVNQQCMSASGGASPDPFSRDNLLSTLLSAGGKGSAKYAFKSQIEKCNPNWLDYFFQGLSLVVRRNISNESWEELIAAYVHAAEINKANMQVIDVIARNDVRAILSDGVTPLYRMFERDEIAQSTSAEINGVIARKYKVAEPGIVKITDDQLKAFLTMLSREISFGPARNRAVCGRKSVAW